jgi:hypothetical protein
VERGTCRLCLKDTMLCDSHLAPAGLYRYCAASELGPVRMTAQEISVSKREVTAYLLCQKCEDVLNREGENWLLPKLATIDKRFQFYDILSSGTPDTTENGVAAFAASRNPKIGFRKLNELCDRSVLESLGLLVEREHLGTEDSAREVRGGISGISSREETVP